MSLSRRSMLAGAFACGLPRFARPQNSELADVTARVRTDLERHASFGYKFAGGPGDLATADWIARRLTDLGYVVERREALMPYWDERIAQLRIGPVSLDVEPQTPVVSTGSDGISGPLALVEDSIAELRGRIAVYLTPFGRHAAISRASAIGRTVTEIAAAGASAIIVVTRGPSGEAIALNVQPSAPFVNVPMAILAPRDAAPVIAAARMGARSTLIMHGETSYRSSPNLIAHLQRGQAWIAVSTPRSGWYHCVAERGTGTAAFLEIAAWAVGQFPEHSIWLLNSGGHEYYFAGSEQLFADPQGIVLPPADNTAVWVHIGATLAVRGAEQRDGEFVMTESADTDRRLTASQNAHAALATAFSGLPGYEVPNVLGGGELPVFLDRGYRTGFATIATHTWFHTSKDTLDRVNESQVVEVLRAYQRGIRLLAAE